MPPQSGAVVGSESQTLVLIFQFPSCCGRAAILRVIDPNAHPLVMVGVVIRLDAQPLYQVDGADECLGRLRAAGAALGEGVRRASTWGCRQARGRRPPALPLTTNASVSIMDYSSETNRVGFSRRERGVGGASADSEGRA